VHQADQTWLIYLVMVLYGLSYGVLGPAQSALLTNIVPTDLLGDANGVLELGQGLLRLLGPLAGAGLFIIVGPHRIALIDAATFLVAAASLVFVRVNEAAPQPRRQRWTHELAAGMRYIVKQVALRQALVAGVIAATVFGFGETLMYALTSQGLHRPPAFVGVLVAVQGAGAILGALTAAPLGRRVGEGWTMGIAFALMAGGALTALPARLPLVVAAFALFGISLPWVMVSLMTLAQRVTPSELQGRVFAAGEMWVTTPQALSIALGAALISVVGYRVLLGIMAVVLAIAAGYLLTRRAQRPTAMPQAPEAHASQSQASSE
jgi:MFS family permease